MSAEGTWSDLVALASMSDDQINFEDAAETTNFEGARRGRYDPLRRKEFDVRAIANWFIEKARSTNQSYSKVWINKLVFLAYEMGIKDYGVVLTPARVEAWNYGPVFREVYSQYGELSDGGYYQKFSIAGRKKIKAEADFESQDLLILEKVWDEYSALSATRLSELTHADGTPWKTVWDLGGDTNPGMAISPAIILSRKGGSSYGNR